MNLLITGGLGHIGSYLIRDLSKQLPIENITIIDSLRTQRFTSLFNLPKKPQIKFIESDVKLLKKNLIPNVLKYDFVIHLAAMTDASGSILNGDELFKNNLESTKSVIEYCINFNLPLIFPSTTSVYGSQEVLVDESCLNLNPQSPYAECKLVEENSIIESSNFGLKSIIMRLGTIHGVSEGMRFHTAVNKFCFQAANSLPLTVWETAMNQYRPYLSLNDASRAILHIIRKGLFESEVYNIVTANKTVLDIIKYIENHSKVKCKINYVKNEIMNQLSYEVSNLKFIETGFIYNGSMSTDIKETLELLSGLN